MRMGSRSALQWTARSRTRSLRVMSRDEHAIRNAAAVTLANIEHLVFLFRNERAEAPFLHDADEESRRHALQSLDAADRAVRQLVRALRETSPA